MLFLVYMPLLCSKIGKLLFLTIFLTSLVFYFHAGLVFATHKCGTDGVCQPVHETCSNCPQDCGVCPTPTSVSTPTPTSSGSSEQPQPTQSQSTATAYAGPVRYPSVLLNAQTPNPTNRTSLTFSGHASIENGVIDAVQYTFDDGKNWIYVAPLDGKFDEDFEEFAFTRSFADGQYTVNFRAKSLSQVFTQSSNYSADTFTVVAAPPKVTLDDFFSNPTKNQNQTITGRVNSLFGKITKVEVSMDAGKTWKKATITGSKFSFVADRLEDGNYEVLARGFDNARNVGESGSDTLIVDTIPPIAGGINISIGPQVLAPHADGVFSLLRGVDVTFAVSFRGGPTKVSVRANDKEFDLSQIPASNIWAGKLSFDGEGQGTFKILAEDGAGNKTDRHAGSFKILQDGKTIRDTTVTVYFFEKNSSSWVLWDGAAYGQENPQKASQNGNYSFIVPSGKYFVEAGLSGYRISQSEIFEVTAPTIVNFDIPLSLFPIPFLRSLIPPKSFDISFERGEKLTDIQGASLLAFISFWSTSSQEQILALDAASIQKGKEKIRVVFVQEKKSSVDAFIKRGGYGFTPVYDEKGDLSVDFGIGNLPQIILLDEKGSVVEKINKVLTKSEILTKLR